MIPAVICLLDNKGDVVRLAALPLCAPPLSISDIHKSFWSSGIAALMEDFCCTSEHAGSHENGAPRLGDTGLLTKGNLQDRVAMRQDMKCCKSSRGRMT
jgi:hypothetical protein